MGTKNKKIRRILLIEPSITRPKEFDIKKIRIGIVPPLGLAYIASVLIKNGFEVKIVDCLIEGSLKGEKYSTDKIRYGLSDKKIKKIIENYSPDVVGVSCAFSAKEFDVLNIFEISKKINKEIITLTGGAHPTNAYQQMLINENLDYVILGEGEYSTLELLLALDKKKGIKKIDGIAYKKNNKILVNPKKKFIENLDELPLPARHLLKMNKYIYTSSPHSGIKRQPFTSIISSRGCPNLCSFCVIRNIWGQKTRFRSAQNVLKEIEHLIKTYGIKEIHFEDDNLTVNKNRIKAILQGIINKGWDLTLNSPSGLSLITLDEELLTLMKKAGYYSISIAIESGDVDILRLMRKPVNLNKALEVIRIARKVGLKTKGFFILGYPGETKTQMQKTVNFAAKSNLDWSIFFIATPIPGSELDRLCQEKGFLIDKNLDYIKQFYVSNIKTDQFDPAYVEKIREEANFSINFRNNVNIRLKNYQWAIEDIGEVVKLYPHLDFAHYYLGLAYEKSGKINLAFEEFKKTLSLNPKHKQAQKKIKAWTK